MDSIEGSLLSGTNSASKSPPVSIPPHLIAEAMQAKHGGEKVTVADVRWSAPISQDEMSYVEEYVKARYPEIYMERVVGVNLSMVDEEGEDSDPSTPGSSRRVYRGDSSGGVQNNLWMDRWGPSGAGVAEEPGKARLSASRLAEILASNSVSMDNCMSVKEIHARYSVLRKCGVDQEEYHVVFTASSREAFMLVAEAYPFHKHNVYMTSIDESIDPITQFASMKEAKVITAPVEWLDLRIPGSQLSTNFRKKSRSNPKGLFAYSLQSGKLRNPLHWVSEAQRNLWHVLLDASEVALDDQSPFDLKEHKPDYLVCVSPKIVGFKREVSCLLVRSASHLR